MDFNYSVLKNDEKAIFKMRALYEKYGYSQYKMSKFEEYDLYVRNKDFLVSENIITFTDTNGKLMALKPDVTLSIIKNSGDRGGVTKVYYNENVYRVSKGTDSFKEIMQVGLECMGDIDTYNIYEVIMLALESLGGISPDCVLDISNMDIILKLLDNICDDAKAKSEIIRCIGEKNVHEISDVAEKYDISRDGIAKLIKLVTLFGTTDEVIAGIKAIAGDLCEKEIKQLEDVVTLLTDSGYGEKIRIDFSVISDSDYYNGFIFKGFIKGISSRILSGGQYDRLMKRMKKSSGAIGFAVYLDLLERYGEEAPEYDVDTVILYDENTKVSEILAKTSELSGDGKSVMATREASQKLKFRELINLKGE